MDKPEDFRVGQRVQPHPATNAWMQGDRYGTVVKIGRVYLQVEMDRSGKVIHFKPHNLLPMYEA